MSDEKIESENLKAKILAGDKEITVEVFEKLILTGSYSEKELQELYKALKSFLHGGRFTAYADIIFTHHPVVDPLRNHTQKSPTKKSIVEFFAPGGDKRAREPGEGDTKKDTSTEKSPKKKPAAQTIQNYFQKTPKAK